jgi:hypothetical protein
LAEKTPAQSLDEVMASLRVEFIEQANDHLDELDAAIRSAEHDSAGNLAAFGGAFLERRWQMAATSQAGAPDIFGYGPGTWCQGLGTAHRYNVGRHTEPTGSPSRRPRALLAPIYDWFTEGFNTPDLIDAKVLLDELS